MNEKRLWLTQKIKIIRTEYVLTKSFCDCLVIIKRKLVQFIWLKHTIKAYTKVASVSPNLLHSLIYCSNIAGTHFTIRISPKMV